MIVPAIAAAIVLTSCYRAGPNMPLRPIPPLPGVASREAETRAFYQGYGLGRQDREHSRSSDFTRHSARYDASTGEAFIQGYRTGHSLLPKPAR